MKKEGGNLLTKIIMIIENTRVDSTYISILTIMMCTDQFTRRVTEVPYEMFLLILL